MKLRLNLIIFLFLFNFPVLHSQPTDTPIKFGVKDFPERVKDIEFYPLGWSKSSNFAYIYAPPAGMRGDSWFFVVQNAKTDKVFINIDIEYEFNKYYSTFDELWSSGIYWKIKRYLDQYQIRIADQNFDQPYLNFDEISHRSGKNFKVSYRSIKDEVEDNVDFSTYEAVVGFRIKVSNRYGSKTISRFNSGDRIDGARYIGSIKSPYENRVVIITAYDDFDWQGDFAGINIHISGCSLNSGFK